MPLVHAKCTNCGANLEVDDSKETAICPACNTPYIVEKAIKNITVTGTANFQNANVTIQGGSPSIDNLLARAIEFERNGEYDKALDYYNKVLDLDYKNQRARDGIEYIRNLTAPKQDQVVQEQLIMSVPCTGGFIPGEFKLTNKKLIYITKKETISYDIDEIEFVDSKFAKFIMKTKGGKKKVYPLGMNGLKDAPLLVNAINNLKS